jgi:long-chain acyl-CoA synthetase
MEEKKPTGYPSIDKPWLKHYSEEAIHTSIPECTIYEYIWNRNKECLDKPALNYFDKRITYRQMFSYIDRAAKAFSAIGVQQGELVSICMLTMPETTYTIYALNKLGAICNLIEPRTNAELIKDRINATHSRVLVVVDVFLPKIMQIVDKTQLEQIIVVPLAESMSLAYKVGFSCTKGRKIPGIPADKRFRYWNAFIKSGTDQDFISAPYQKDAPAAIIYTGGTTGIPKGALLSNDGMVTMAVESKYTAPRLWEGNRFLGIMPPFIAYGLVFGQFIPFCAGSETVQIPVFDPKKFDELVLKYKPNHVIGVPSFFEMLADSKKVRKKKLDFLLCAITGGDKLLEGTETHINQFLADHGCKHRIMKGYGMTEIGSAATFTSADETNLPGSVGIPARCINVKIIDPASGEELTYGQQGEICLCGKTMMLGYYNNDAETQKVMHTHQDGSTWIHSGDIGYVNEDGVVFIVDRIKRMIIRPDGHNVWPSRIEEVAMRHPAVKDCAVVGMPNPENENGKIPTAFIVVEDSHEANDALIEDIDRFSKEQLPERDVAMAYRFIEQLPLTLVGKADYRALERESEVL